MCKENNDKFDSIATDMFWFWIQIRELYENTKDKIKNLISK